MNTQVTTQPQAASDEQLPANAQAEALPATESQPPLDALIAMRDDGGYLVVEGHVRQEAAPNNSARIVATYIMTNWDAICKAAHQAYLKSLGTLDVTQALAPAEQQEPQVVAPGPQLRLVSPNGGFVDAG